MDKLPLFFTFEDGVVGAGFLAHVVADGKILLRLERDGVGLYGVTPGALAAHGDNPDEAEVNFRDEYRRVLLDVASSAPDFETFELCVRRFLEDSSAATEAEWNSALDEVRKSDLSIPGLKRRSASDPLNVVIRRIEAPDEFPKLQFILPDDAAKTSRALAA